ncbi:VIR-like CYIR protein [Plasmodium cynomolgi strain B]|uniref:VIR-like CYIR protein n=1 Tax=Plasmodium cynomolgi (strain B) TaxID=1120755 RepID=K6UJ49_PLACD|nr:VIR-like CYIR protein [Plasmodium cynomolgi strain B]GAB65593.1 VIR-like CYIR protein [Plasmodium cynomolgi strain B]
MFYQKLQDEKDSTDVNRFCSNVFNTYTNKYPWLYKICGQLIKNVELVRDDSDYTFRRKHCFDINYWLYDEIYKKLESTNKESDFRGIIKLFDTTWKKFIGYSYDIKSDEVCFPNITLFRDNFLTYLKQLKNFLDYIENYNFIKREIGKSTYYACQKYFDYLKERIPLFFSFEPLCRKHGSNICTDYIQGYFLSDPRKLFTNYELSKLYFQSWWNPCYKKVLNVFYDFKKSPTEFIARYNEYVKPFSNNPVQQKVKLAQSGEVKPPNAASNAKAAAVREIPVSVKPQDVTAQLPAVNVQLTDDTGQPRRITVPLTSATVTTAAYSEQLAEMSSDVHSDDGIFTRFINEQGFPLIKIVLVPFLSVLLITLLIKALSKFTSLGNLFSRRRKRKKIDLQYNNYPVDGDLIFDSYDSFSTSSDESEHNIAYSTM